MPWEMLKEETMLTAADVMTREVVSVGPHTPVRATAELLYTRRISGVPVLEEGSPHWGRQSRAI